jgi:hypothetical protein
MGRNKKVGRELALAEKRKGLFGFLKIRKPLFLFWCRRSESNRHGREARGILSSQTYKKNKNLTP